MIGRISHRLVSVFMHFKSYFSSPVSATLLDRFLSPYDFWTHPSCHNARWVLTADDRSTPENHSYMWTASSNFIISQSDCELREYIPLNPNYMHRHFNFVLAVSPNATLREWKCDGGEVGVERGNILNQVQLKYLIFEHFTNIYNNVRVGHLWHPWKVLMQVGDATTLTSLVHHRFIKVNLLYWGWGRALLSHAACPALSHAGVGCSKAAPITVFAEALREPCNPTSPLPPDLIHSSFQLWPGHQLRITASGQILVLFFSLLVFLWTSCGVMTC